MVSFVGPAKKREETTSSPCSSTQMPSRNAAKPNAAVQPDGDDDQSAPNRL